MKALVSLLAVACLVCSAANAQETAGNVGYPALTEVSYSYYGGGARAMAMGYAFVGLADDVSSGLWNPAGLWILENPQVAASYNMYSPAGEFTQSLTPGVTKNDLGINAIGHFSFVAPVRIKGHPFVFNFNFDHRNEFTSEASYEGISVRGERTFTEEDKGFLRVFNFGGSTRVYRQLSVGLLLNVYTGNRTIDNRETFTRDSLIDPVYNISQEKITVDRMLDSTTSSGFNFTAGLMYKAEKFSVGATVHSPFAIRHSTDRSQFVVTTKDGLSSLEDSDTTYVLDSLAKQDIPLSLSFGVGAHPLEELTVTLDANYQNYGSTNWFYRTGFFFDAGGDRTDYYDEIPIDWNNTFGVGAGVEYTLKTGLGQLPVRAGVRYDQLPQPRNFTLTSSNVGYDALGDPYELDQTIITRVAKDRQSEISLGLGTGISWSQIKLDFAYRYSAGAELNERQVTIMYDDTDEADPVKETVIDRKWERKAHEFRFTFSGYF